jgi:Protein of unknown function (DUF2568)
MTILKSVNLLIRFLLELCVLASIGYWGFQYKNWIYKLGMGVGLPILVAVVWGIFVAPKSSHQLPLPYRLFVEFLVLGLGAYALYASGHTLLSKIFIGIIIVNITLLLIWKQ